MSHNPELLERIRSAQAHEMTAVTVPGDLAQRARDGVRRRRLRRRAVGLVTVLLAVAGTAVGVWQRPSVGEPAASQFASGAADEVDGVLIGYLPPGYRRIGGGPTTDYSGQLWTIIRYGTTPDPQGSNSKVPMRPGDILIFVWRVRADNLTHYPEKPETSPTTRNPFTLRDKRTTWENSRQEPVSTLSTVGISGVEVPASVIDRIASSLKDPHPWTPAPAIASTTRAAATAFALTCGGGGSSAVDRPDLAGQLVDEVRLNEVALGHEVRVVGTDGTCAGRREDLRTGRVNLYVEHGLIVWAQMF
jgi:hypothetical protein